MVNGQQSSLQKAVSRSTSSLNNASRRDSKGRNSVTETSFEIGSPMDIDNSTELQLQKTVVTRRNSASTKKVTKNRHFTIIENNCNKMSATGMDVDSTHANSTKKGKTQTSFVVGSESELDYDHSNNVDGDVDQDVEQMQGVIDQGTKMPLIVLDGANVAFAYGTAIVNNDDNEKNTDREKSEPDVRGIQIATDHFVQYNMRILVVLPQYFFYSNSKNGTNNVANDKDAQKILGSLKKKGHIVVSPPTDDDDAYCLTIARREEDRSIKEPRIQPAFVLSNDLFRDAQQRDPTAGSLKEWLNNGRNSGIGPGRISYTFGNLQTMNDRGEYVLDFLPNPRHPLVLKMNKGEHSNSNIFDTAVTS